MDINTTFGYWVTVANLTGFKLGRYTRPSFVGSVEVPPDLSSLTIGQLIELSGLKDETESLYRIADIVLGLDRAQVSNARAVDVVRLAGWVATQVEKVNSLMNAIGRQKYTSRERQAGVEGLKFGLFGMLDWYALRMGIEDHDKVLEVPWMRVYKCMDMDAKRNAYERKLSEITSKEINNNGRRRR